MDSIAIGIFCKTPAAGLSKTRLSPPLSREECAALSACFIRDVATTVSELTGESVSAYAIYTPVGSEEALRELLPAGFRLLAQSDGDLGSLLTAAMRELLAAHAGVILICADSPTLPVSILRAAVDVTLRGGAVVLSPALDGGYLLIALSAMHERLFADIPWSTAQVHERTVARAAEIGWPVVNVPGWYDVDDAASLALFPGLLLAAVLPAARPNARTRQLPSRISPHAASRCRPCAPSRLIRCRLAADLYVNRPVALSGPKP